MYRFLVLIQFLIFIFSSPLCSEEYLKVIPARKINFPESHGAHKDFKNEWWYLTGHLRSEEETFGFQLTFFRIGVTKHKSKSPFRTDSIYIAHFAFTDDYGKKFYYDQVISRPIAGESGAEKDKLNVWIKDWILKMSPKEIIAKAKNEKDNISINLQLNNTKPAVLHGKNGYSIKYKNPLMASYYYSFSRLSVEGHIKIKNKTKKVIGNAWLDHEVLQQHKELRELGWDWFAIQLDDNREIMLFEVRGADKFYSGTFIDEYGKAKPLKKENFKIEKLTSWESKKTGISYPSSWKIMLKEPNLELIVKPTVENQELSSTDSTGIHYFEGRSIVYQKNKQIGNAYVELVGY